MDMGKYTALGDYLQQRGEDEVAMTFDEIEAVIGAPLPASQKQAAWWSNNPGNNVMTKAWLAAGFRTERVDVQRRRLVFRRLYPRDTAKGHSVQEPTATWEVRPMPKTTKPPLFGWMKGQVRIAPGADLTAPADPEWAAQA